MSHRSPGDAEHVVISKGLLFWNGGAFLSVLIQSSGVWWGAVQHTSASLTINEVRSSLTLTLFWRDHFHTHEFAVSGAPVEPCVLLRHNGMLCVIAYSVECVRVGRWAGGCALLRAYVRVHACTC